MGASPIKHAASLGPLIKAWRQTRGLSQADLGRQLGISQARIANIESDAGKVNLDQVIRLLAVLGKQFSVEDLPTVVVAATGHFSGSSRVHGEGRAIRTPDTTDDGDGHW